jgi:fused signal recognition particle receptor
MVVALKSNTVWIRLQESGEMSEEKSNKGGFFSRLFKREKAEAPDEVHSSPEVSEARNRAAGEIAASEQVDAGSYPAAEDEAESLLKLRTGLGKTRSGFIAKLDRVLLGGKELDEQLASRLEEVLITADIGVRTAYQLLDSVTDRLKRRDLDRPDMVTHHLKGVVKEILAEVEAPLRVGYGSEPFVVMVVGVNGSGKTTTIAKIAARHKAAGRKVMMVAADTFRAAAVEQIEIWGERVGCTVVRGKEKADPSSVAFEALERALVENVELVLVDTAGRLHTRVPLMEELKKVRRTLAKKLPSAPHETLLVIDASMGQNAILQAQTFNEAVPVTGIALTKLDGTSKGGVVVGISNELKIPIRFVGVGEKMDDLRDFNAAQFTEALFGQNGG